MTDQEKPTYEIPDRTYCRNCRKVFGATAIHERCALCGGYLFHVPSHLHVSTGMVAEVFGVEKQTVSSWIRRGFFPCARKFSGHWMIPIEHVQEFEPPKSGYPKGRPRTRKDC
ncbi:MAG: helix-turn-helix domain-containing protein [Ardenticatenia bacterium]|nr:helix-turn-helix domain-containing protein [Ardenticatenia bacterium]